MRPTKLTHNFVTRWRNAKGQLCAAPKNPKRPPKGYKSQVIAYKKDRTKKKDLYSKDYDKSLNKDLVKIHKKLQKKIIPISAEQAKRTTLHLRFKTLAKNAKFKKVNPRNGSKYYIGIYRENRFLGFWKNTEPWKMTREVRGMMADWQSQNRFATDKRIKFLFEGETLKDAISKISFDGLHYKARVLIDVQFTAKGSGEKYEFEIDPKNVKRTLRYQHTTVIECVQMFGLSYDEWIQEQILKNVSAYFREMRVRFTSGETLQYFNESDRISDSHFNELLTFSQVYDVKGHLFAQIL